MAARWQHHEICSANDNAEGGKAEGGKAEGQAAQTDVRPGKQEQRDAGNTHLQVHAERRHPRQSPDELQLALHDVREGSYQQQGADQGDGSLQVEGPDL
eukprot:CAMPEP_0204554548 /NCGR_PEP_ID=MMETSP0661-20131031/28203_1 /ASSEMBLY_ACC=CAM_ASM_000606 /TAXON_ID=109239 /ORGANISM="Alexandrium margalefi, Strain AMGDE01CS-322" /LENGTH=98 /DNA_ID=CAMNT_0051561623 /DNA_START=247 /DNA_END=540 /DNA_ORIENTATION=-